MREFRTTQLLEMQKSLEYCLEAVKSSINFRRNMIENKTMTEYEKMQDDSVYSPEDYYCFRILDKGVGIVRTRKFYSIKCYSWSPTIFKDNKWSEIPYVSFIQSYGRFETLEVAKIYFYRAVLELMCKCGYKVQPDLFDY